jgi:hypothetical protein
MQEIGRTSLGCVLDRAAPGQGTNFPVMLLDAEKALTSSGKRKIRRNPPRYVEGSGKFLKVFRHFKPVIHAHEAGDGKIVGRRVQQPLALEALQVAGLIVDQKVGAQN